MSIGVSIQRWYIGVVRAQNNDRQVSTVVEKRLDLFQQEWKLALKDVPDESIVDLGVAVDQYVSEGDDLLVIRESNRYFLDSSRIQEGP